MRRMFIGPITCMLVCVLPALTVEGGLLTGLDGFWSFDETSGPFADVSGNGNSLAPEGVSPHGDGSNGILGGALNLDGSGERAVAANTNIGAYSSADSFTLSMWMKPTDAFSAFHWFAGREHSGDKRGWALRNGISNRELLRLNVRGTPNDVGFDYATPLFTLANAGEWVFLAVTFDGSDNDLAKLFVNGSQVASTNLGLGAAGNYLPSSDTYFSVGTRNNDVGGAVSGMIDEVGLWSRALSDDEIATLYNNGAGLRVPEPAGATMLLMALLAALGARPRRR